MFPTKKNGATFTIGISKNIKKPTMFKKNSVVFAGEEGLIFTDETGETFFAECQKISSDKWMLFSDSIRRISIRELTDEEREIIISKIDKEKSCREDDNIVELDLDKVETDNEM